MKITITEPTFFLGQNREPGDVLDVEVGPFRTEVIPGGLKRIKQFVEMPEEIKQVLQEAVSSAGAQQVGQNGLNGSQQSANAPTSVVSANPAPATFAEATASILKPTAPAKPISGTAAILSGLAGRRRKLDETIGNEAADYAKLLDQVEAAVPQTFTKARESLADRQASLAEIEDSLKDLAGANGPLQG